MIDFLGFNLKPTKFTMTNFSQLSLISLAPPCPSFASLEILAFAGNAFFMILLTLVMERNLSCFQAENSVSVVAVVRPS
jgi:hypothetical protein